MNESKAMESVDRNQPEPITPDLAKRMDQLYDHSEAVKMVSLQAFMALGRQDDGANEAAVTKLSQMALKAIEIQLRILAESGKQGKDQKPALPQEVWDALLDTPSVGSLLRQPRVHDKLVDQLRRLAEGG